MEESPDEQIKALQSKIALLKAVRLIQFQIYCRTEMICMESFPWQSKLFNHFIPISGSLFGLDFES